MLRFLICIMGTVIFAGCATQKVQPEKEYWVQSYKKAIAIAALKQAVPNVDSMDSTPSAVTNLIGDYRFKAEADSAGSAFYQSIEPSLIFQREGWKPILGNVLEYYSSKELDQLAKAAYKRYKATRKAVKASY